MLTAEQNETAHPGRSRDPDGGADAALLAPGRRGREMAGRWTERVRLLGEDLVLYPRPPGPLGLIGESCPHRRASLAYGIPTHDGFARPIAAGSSTTPGSCLEQPNEPEAEASRTRSRCPPTRCKRSAG